MAGIRPLDIFARAGGVAVAAAEDAGGRTGEGKHQPGFIGTEERVTRAFGVDGE